MIIVRPSPGTRITMKLSKFREINQIINGTWRKYTTNSLVFDTAENIKLTAVPYPLPEIALFNRNFGAKNISSHLLLPPEEALFVRPHKEVEGNIQEELQKLRLRKRPGAETEERAKQHCEIYLEIESEKGKNRKSQGYCKGYVLDNCKLHTLICFIFKDKGRFTRGSP